MKNIELIEALVGYCFVVLRGKVAGNLLLKNNQKWLVSRSGEVNWKQEPSFSTKEEAATYLVNICKGRGDL